LRGTFHRRGSFGAVGQLAAKMDAIPYVDTLVREYLLFRGFTQSLRAFDAERGTDRTSGFQADKVVELIFNVHIPKYEYDKLVALLDFLDSRWAYARSQNPPWLGATHTVCAALAQCGQQCKLAC